MREITQDIIRKNWELQSSDINILYDSFMNNISNSVDKICPLRKATIAQKLWVKISVKDAQKERD